MANKPDSFEEAIYEAEERGARSARASRAARTKAKRVEHERTTARELERRKTVQTRTRAEGRKQKSLTERERERTRRHTTEQSQRTARELSRERASAQRQRSQERLAAERRRSRRSGGGGSGGSLGLTGSGEGLQISKTAGRNIVLACIVGSALAVSFRSSKQSGGIPQAITLKSGQVVRVPANLRSLGGVMLAGTAALVLTEINTPLGVVFGILLLLDSGFGTALGGFTSAFFNGAKPQPYLPDSAGGVAGTGEKFDPKTGIISGSRGNFRLVPVGNGNYSVEPLPNPNPKPGPQPDGTYVT